MLLVEIHYMTLYLLMNLIHQSKEMVVESFTLLRQQYMNEVHKQHAKEATANDIYEPMDSQMKTPVSVIELLLQKFGKEAS